MGSLPVVIAIGVKHFLRRQEDTRMIRCKFSNPLIPVCTDSKACHTYIQPDHSPNSHSTIQVLTLPPNRQFHYLWPHVNCIRTTLFAARAASPSSTMSSSLIRPFPRLSTLQKLTFRSIALPRSVRSQPKRTYADYPKPPTPSGPSVERGTVWAPKTRIAVGIVFIGTLIYSMVDIHRSTGSTEYVLMRLSLQKNRPSSMGAPSRRGIL